jgi:branched-chain amino acid transport system substrate-binding protein
VPAQQLDPFISWLMRKTGAKTFYLPSADYIWPHVMNERVRQLVAANGGSIVGEEYYPLDHMEYGETVGRIMSSGAEVVFNTIDEAAVLDGVDAKEIMVVHGRRDYNPHSRARHPAV